MAVSFFNLKTMFEPLMLSATILIFMFVPTLALVECHNISCPNEIITGKGSFPEQLSNVSTNFDCVLKFEIPSGFVVRFSLKSETPIENIRNLTYVVNAQKKFNHFPNLSEHSYIFATASTAELHIHTGNKTANMQIKYHFIDIRHFTGTIVDAGTVQSLNIKYQSFLTFRASEKVPNIKIELATVTEHPEDDPSADIFVYEGLDLQGDCLGTLANFENKMITPSYQEEDSNNPVTFLSIVFFNSRRNYANSFVISNTKATLENFTNYTLLMSSDTTVHQFSDFSNKTSAITFFCSDNCKAMYIEKMEFHQGNGSVEIVPFAPYHQNPKESQERDVRTPAIIYKNMSYSSLQELPQQIPVSMFTILIKNTTISIKVTTNEKKWLTPHEGRKITVYSPSYWNSSAPAGFSYRFQNRIILPGPHNNVVFTINLLSMNATHINEVFHITAGSGGHNPRATSLNCEDHLEICFNDFERREIEQIGDFAKVEFVASTWPSSAIVEIQVAKQWTLWDYFFP